MGVVVVVVAVVVVIGGSAGRWEARAMHEYKACMAVVVAWTWVVPERRTTARNWIRPDGQRVPAPMFRPVI